MVPESRLWLGALLVFLVFAVFLGRLFYLQVVQGEALRVESERNSVRTVRLDAPRGNILDREGRVIASTRPAFDVEIIPSELRDADRVYSALGQLLDEQASQVRETVGKPRGRARFQPIPVSSDLSFEQLARVETHRFALPGVVTEVRPQRQYEDGDLAGHLLGTLGEIRLEQLDRTSFEDYSAGEIIGQSGLEAVLENVLRGTAGGRNVVVNVSGREVERLDEVEPVPGNTAVLTLDLDLQREAVAAYRNDPPLGPPAPAARESESPPAEKMGALVALDPRTGDVLALVSRPSFDPNDFADGVPPETWHALIRDERRPLQNRAISGQYPPGSTYKPLLAAAALESGVINPQTHFFCPGSFAFGRRVYKCWKKEGHGSVAVHEAIVRSCDVFFYQTGLKLGIDRIADFGHALTFGRLTGIPLPEEKPGLIPTEAWKQRRFGEPWMAGETVSASIGQGFDLVTPLQLAVAYGALATGVVMKPRLVLRVEKPDGSLLEETKPQLDSRLPISEANLEIVRKGLAGVVNEPGGTGGRARLPGITVAGKTGTAQVIRLEHFEGVDESRVPMRYRDHAWFVCFAPAEAPEIVVAVLNEHAGHGGSAAAPIAQRVLAKYFEKQGRLAPEALMASQAPKAPAPPRPHAKTVPPPPPPPPAPSEPAGAEPVEGGTGDAAD
ncbi:MAG TPA: penicillin-binding protein 2 [Myxococcota bacterium]|nr:penicillin-binding protein 2 [Myxococcota bacterium]